MAGITATADRRRRNSMVSGRCKRWTVICAAMAAALPVAAHAGDLQITPRITVGEIYTDNLFLSPPGSSDKADDFITEIEPGFNLKYQAPQLIGNIDYQLQGLLYANHGGQNDVYNELNANATLAVVPDLFYVDGMTMYDQQVINPERPAGRSNLFGGMNRTNVSSSTISPYFKHDFGSIGIATLRYAYGRAIYTESNIPNASSNTLSFLLARQPQYGDLTYDLSYSHQRIDRDFGRDFSFEQARLGLQYQVSGFTQLLVNVGKENDYHPDGSFDRLGATFWSAGFRVKSQINEFKALVGHRFFGRSWELEWQHNGADFHTDLSYEEQPTDFNRLLLSRGSQALINSPLPEVQLPSLREQRIFVLKRAAASVRYDMARSQIQLRLYDERRDFINLANNERVQGGGIDWNFQLGLRDSFIPTFDYERYEFTDGRINHTTRSQVDWRHRLSQSMTLDLALRHERRDSNGAGDYRVNTILAELTKLF